MQKPVRVQIQPCYKLSNYSNPTSFSMTKAKSLKAALVSSLRSSFQELSIRISTVITGRKKCKLINVVNQNSLWTSLYSLQSCLQRKESIAENVLLAVIISNKICGNSFPTIMLILIIKYVRTRFGVIRCRLRCISFFTGFDCGNVLNNWRRHCGIFNRRGGVYLIHCTGFWNWTRRQMRGQHSTSGLVRIERWCSHILADHLYGVLDDSYGFEKSNLWIKTQSKLK